MENKRTTKVLVGIIIFLSIALCMSIAVCILLFQNNSLEKKERTILDENSAEYPTQFEATTEDSSILEVTDNNIGGQTEVSKDSTDANENEAQRDNQNSEGNYNNTGTVETQPPTAEKPIKKPQDETESAVPTLTEPVEIWPETDWELPELPE